MSRMILAALLTAAVAANAQQAQLPPQQAAPSQLSRMSDGHTVSVDQLNPDATPVARLSQTSGVIRMDRNLGLGFETALPNLAIVAGDKLRTLNGLAEVQLRDGSTLRLTPNSQLDFQQMADGTQPAILRLDHGMAYVERMKSPSDALQVNFGTHTAEPQSGSHLDLRVGDPGTRLVVFDGDVQLTPEALTVGKKKTVLFDTVTTSTAATPEQIASLISNPAPIVKDGAEKSSFDEWDREAMSYDKRYNQNPGQSPYVYGLADLNYYGQFVNDPECGGRFWQPFLISSAWDPYANGFWAWYPTMGYSWVSVYPWGWLPYHSGAWNYCGARGWGWTPNGRWSSVRNRPVRTPTSVATSGTLQPGGIKRPPHHEPPTPPSQPPHGRLSLVSANPQPIIGSALVRGQYLLRNNSAGLGVARGSVSLKSASSNVEHHGYALAPLRTSVVSVGAHGEMNAAVHNNSSERGANSGNRNDRGDNRGGDNRSSGNTNAQRSGSNSGSSSGSSSSHGSYGGGSGSSGSGSHGGSSSGGSSGGGGSSAPAASSSASHK